MYTELCKKILNRIVNEELNDSNPLYDMSIWDWSQGVALYGIWNYYSLTGETGCLDYLKRWFDGKMGTPPVRNVNSTAPLLTLCELYEETGREDYLSFCTAWADWILDEMPKTEMRGVQHITIDSDNEQQMWADTVFMTVLFLARLGKLTQNARYTEEAARQLVLHIRYLAQKDSGLWCHGWSFLRKDNFAGALWARGNAWFTLAAAELPELAALPGWVETFVLDAYRQQVEALAALQSPGGLWHTLLNAPDSYVEVSGSAGIAAGMLRGVRMGYLPENYAKTALKAAKAVLEQVDGDGVVHGVSYGTIVADNLDYYKQVSLRSTGYGQNLTLILLVELLCWERRENA